MTLFSWLGDLVAQLLEQEGIVAPQRRRWNLRGLGWDVRDDPDLERLDIFIDGEAVIKQNAPETLLILGDDLPAAHDYLRELRRGIVEKSGNVSLVGDIQSPDGFHSAIAGDTLATIETRLTALTIAEPSAILILAGRKDIDNSDSASTIAAAFTSLLVAIRAKFARSRIILGDPTRWFSPAAGFAAKTAVAEALYPLLATIADDTERTVYIPSGSLLDEDTIDASGSLPNTNGHAFLAVSFIRAIQNAIPPIYGRETPRGFVKRNSQPTKLHHVARKQDANISFPTPATGAGELTMVFWYYVDALFTTIHTITRSAASFTLIAKDRDLILRSGNGAAIDIVALDVLTYKRWHRIAIVLDPGAMRFYVNGQLRGLETAAGNHNWSVTSVITIGSTSTVVSMPGWYADVIFSDVAATDAEVNKDYFDASGLTRNVIARYLLADLTDEMGGAAATNTGMILSNESPLLPGESLPVATYSPAEETDLSHWWRADMGVERATRTWFNQTSATGVDFLNQSRGFPEVLRDEHLWAGQYALSFASSGSFSDASISRHMVTSDTFDFLGEHGYAVCIALLEHAPSDNLEVLLSNKFATTDLGYGLRLSLVEIGSAFRARINIGNGATATITALEVTMRNGSPELITFRFGAAGGAEARLETMVVATTVAQDNAPAAGTGGNLRLSGNAPAFPSIRDFRGHVAEIAIFQNASVATLDALVVSWRAYAQDRYDIKSQPV